ncbi:MAG TPA: PH domain-containing protein [Pirellulales bacterium]|nr:PH domain-containing protein [Pirellulales bacterium]
MSTDTLDPSKITRPDSALMKYYLIVSLLTGPGFFLAILPLFFKYETLHYRFDEEGVAMSWGILFRREIYLTYRRIQDIHLTRNLLQRWLGLATVSVQTASGSSGPGMSIEGVLQADQLRDFLYARMRGARDHSQPGEAPPGERPADEALGLLRDIRDSLARLVARETKA